MASILLFCLASIQRIVVNDELRELQLQDTLLSIEESKLSIEESKLRIKQLKQALNESDL